MAASSVKPLYVPYLFLREPLVETPLDESGSFPATKLPYVAFLQRWQSRRSRYWEDGNGEITPYDFWTLLRSIFIVRAGSSEEAALIIAGNEIASVLNTHESAEESLEAEVVGDCEDIIEGWPSYGESDRIPLWVLAHNFDAWNWHERVWKSMRKSPVEFKPIPDADLILLNQWLFGRYGFSKGPARFLNQLQQAVVTAKKGNSPKKLIAEGVLAGLTNADNLIAFKR
jgi:hypothetical protein